MLVDFGRLACNFEKTRFITHSLRSTQRWIDLKSYVNIIPMEINYEIGTEDIISKLKEWDEQLGIDLSDIGFDRVTVKFHKLPDNLTAFAKEIYEFCPDTIEQGYGCMAEMIEAAEEMGEEIPDHLKELIEGVDLEAENYGLVLLEKRFAKTKGNWFLVGLRWNSIHFHISTKTQGFRHLSHG